MSRLRTPDEMLASAKEHMLNGRDPVTREDWQRVINFVAFNTTPEAADAVCRLMRMIYEIPLSEDDIHAIVLFQNARRES